MIRISLGIDAAFDSRVPLVAMRLLVSSLISLFVVGLLLLIIRFWGLGQNHTEFSSDFFQNTSGYVRHWTDPKLQENDVIWVDIVQNQDPDLVLIPNDSTEAPFLRDYLKTKPLSKMILNLNDNKMGVHQLLAKILKESQANQRVIVQSLYSPIILSTRTEAPSALYGTSQPDLLKFAAMEALHILPAAPFKGDVFIAPLKLKGRPAFSAALIQEMRRRKKSIILGPVSNEQELEIARAHAPDLIFVGF